MILPGVACYKNQGFILTLSNGHELRILFGPRNLAANWNQNGNETMPLSYMTYRCPNAEVLVYNNGVNITKSFFAKHLESMDNTNVDPEGILKIIAIFDLAASVVPPA